MPAPRHVAQMSPKDGEQAKDFDREEREREYVLGGWEARGKHSRCHEGGIRGEGSLELDPDIAAVIEKENVNDHQPCAERPNRIARR